MSSATTSASGSAISSAPGNTETPAPEPGTGHQGQTFLVGDTIYLRRIELVDAPFGMSWRGVRFPQSSDRVETWIKEEMAKDRNAAWYGIVRKTDDRVVGSARVGRAGGMSTSLSLEADPLLGDRGLHLKAEALKLLAPWIVEERHSPMLLMFQAADEPAMIAAAREIGMRQTARFRERIARDSERVDELVFQYLNPHWLGLIGDPDTVELERTGTGQPRPIPPRVTLEGDPPKNAVMIGRRVYLRPFEPGDAVEEGTWARREPETFFDIGRHLWSSVSTAHWRGEGEKKTLPRFIGFSVCLRETDEFIGVVDLLGVDYWNRHAETGSFFHRADYRGGGFGSEAKQLLLEYAFETLGLHSLQSWVYFQNTRSAAALRKQGYTEAGRINWLYPNKGTLDNFVVFDLLAEEWRAMPREAWESPVAR